MLQFISWIQLENKIKKCFDEYFDSHDLFQFSFRKKIIYILNIYVWVLINDALAKVCGTNQNK